MGCVVYTERTEMAADFQYIVSGCLTTVVLMSVCLEQSQCCKELLNGITAQRSKVAFSCCFILDLSLPQGFPKNYGRESS